MKAPISGGLTVHRVLQSGIPRQLQWSSFSDPSREDVEEHHQPQEPSDEDQESIHAPPVREGRNSGAQQQRDKHDDEREMGMMRWKAEKREKWN